MRESFCAFSACTFLTAQLIVYFSRSQSWYQVLEHNRAVQMHECVNQILSTIHLWGYRLGHF